MKEMMGLRLSGAIKDDPNDPDRIIVTGHTVTSLIDKASRGRIWRGNGHIAIDCGAVYSGVLGCLCLDTLEEFYVE